jgi:CTP:molybdopterin cytidylyltransferase MocA
VTAAGLVLAAGGGRRFGRPKALVELDGQLLVDRAVDTVRAAGCDPVVVVLGAAADVVCREARLDAAVVVVNEDWRSGMASSLRAGLVALTDLHAAAAVISLVDQPRIPADAVARLVERWRDGAAAVVATYDGEPRNPVLIDASVWPQVMSVVTGDVGARAWLRTRPEGVVHIACDDLGSAVDIDDPRDLDHLKPDSPLEDRA